MSDDKFKEAYVGMVQVMHEENKRTGFLNPPLKCDMRKECSSEVTHIDEKGYVYCSSHGAMRQCRCRKLTPSEIMKLRAGEQIAYKKGKS